MLFNGLRIVSLSLVWLAALPVLADDFPTPVNSEKATTTPMDPHEVVRTAKLPPGFVLSLVAAEPLIQNPIAMTFDERGRLWVAENYSWSGAGAGGFNPEQRDRIVILEDTDADGLHDKRIVFWDDARLLTGLEVGHGGLWAISLPNLVFIPDRNGDDVPDGPPEIVLNGFDAGIGNHTPANGLKWGPDGWLYGRSGILSPASIGRSGATESQRVKIDTGVWRHHPTRGVTEALMHGMTNPWGFDFNQHGEIFVINTVIGHLWHVLPGAHTERMFGLDISPYSYKLLPQVADHVHWDTGEAWSDVRNGVTDSTSAAGGGHAHIGLMIYQGDNWPEEYRNRVYTLNLHGRRINADHLARNGAGYTATHGPDMCFIADPWFRGMELLTGPDGGVYIADWSDTGECHDHDGVHRTSGRIYKLAYGTPKKIPAFDLATASDADLIALQSHRNVWWARQARRMLTERASGLSPQQFATLRSDLKNAFAASSEADSRLRLLETIGAIGQEPGEWWLERLQSENEYERATALRFLIDREMRDGGSPTESVLNALAGLAKSDRSGIVRLHLASSLQKLPVSQRWQLAEPLAADSEFSNDRMLPLMIWYGIEPAVPLDPSRALSLIESSPMPVLTELVARRLAEELDRNPAATQQLLALVEAGRLRFPESAIAGIAAALDGRQKATVPKNWPAVAAKFSKTGSEETRQQMQSLSVIFGDGQTLEVVRKNVADRNLSPGVRHAALRSLLISPPADFAPELISLLDDRDMVTEAIRGLSRFEAPEIPRRLLERAGRFSSEQRSEMIKTLTSRPAFAKELLAAIEAGSVQAAELSAFHARQIASFGDEKLTQELTRLWGEVRASAADRRALIESHKEKLTPEVLAKADLSAGRGLFQKSCANCHVLYGIGSRVGPDLTGSNRSNLDYLLENIIDPSASVGASFRTQVVVLSDGRVLNGVVTEQSERTLTLQSAQETFRLDRDEIEEMTTTNVSLMPEGQFQNMTPDQIRDLLAYLMATEQVPLPAE